MYSEPQNQVIDALERPITLVPPSNFVLLEIAVQSTTKGGLHLPDTAKSGVQPMGYVRAIGPLVGEGSEQLPEDYLRVGDLVMFTPPSAGGLSVPVYGRYLVVNVDYLLLIVRSGEHAGVVVSEECAVLQTDELLA